MPRSLVRLELALSATSVDLQQASNIIKSDVGLTVQLLGLGIREAGTNHDQIPSVSELVVQAGVERLKKLTRETSALTAGLAGSGSLACMRYWAHARLTALIAEELACEASEVDGDEAYLAGLLCNFGDLPMILGWSIADLETRDLSYLVAEMAKAWDFPEILVELIRGNRRGCSSSKSRALLDLATTANIWAYRLEFLMDRDSRKAMSVSAGR